ncbi:uncharacterized protein BDR25DRAFT_76840 [Lindgomyces ingoldianus]|uniref:Uncharacterized protein n=1 Tax=Lindgomyces ingoldianus TaxID=673940 RepID=A0ACB6QI92_9PLEO|nr:uncharacterized protein BDR25DRAFT_76840 [Lindgomyces ingoldianus]KAF2466240.1 hypothetical protein BDR25DRAFT_76840 [Lindgomyces ingoldianus]
MENMPVFDVFLLLCLLQSLVLAPSNSFVEAEFTLSHRPFSTFSLPFTPTCSVFLLPASVLLEPRACTSIIRATCGLTFVKACSLPTSVNLHLQPHLFARLTHPC